MRIPSVVVVGRAEREVVPDRVVVTVLVTTAVLPSAAEALAACAEARRRLLDHLAATCAGARVTDGRVTTQPERRLVTRNTATGTEEGWEVHGHTGRCAVDVEDAAGRAAAIVAQAGAHPDAHSVVPVFVVGAALARSTAIELEREAVRDALERAAGLAEAAGLAPGQVLSIGESRRRSGPTAFADATHRLAAVPPDAAAAVAEDLGELRPEPERRSESVAVRVALEGPAG
ncbi:MAG: SIMPL domain-containing protein [Thermoleophilia bacterium]